MYTDNRGYHVLHCVFYLHLPEITSTLHVGNFTTNLAECWMSIQAKFDGGKQCNRSQRGAWEGRCAVAGLRQNLGPG